MVDKSGARQARTEKWLFTQPRRGVQTLPHTTVQFITVRSHTEKKCIVLIYMTLIPINNRWIRTGSQPY